MRANEVGPEADAWTWTRTRLSGGSTVETCHPQPEATVILIHHPGLSNADFEAYLAGTVHSLDRVATDPIPGR